MTIDSILASVGPKAQRTIEHLSTELAALAVGRPTPALVDSVEIEQYQTKVPLKSIAQVTVGDAQSLVITPWDKQNLPVIEKAIQAANLGFSPVNNGQNVRIILPPPSEERRNQLLKAATTKTEEARVTIRTIRHELMQELKKLKSTTSEDQLRRSEDELQKSIDQQIAKVDEIGKNKEREIREI